MRKDRIRWMLSIGLLGLLGFVSCSPRLHSRKAKDVLTDTLKIPPVDTLKPAPGVMPPIKLMYGVPPARYEIMEVPENELNKTEQR